MDLLARSRILRSKYLAPLVKPLHRIGITPNHLTFLSLLLGLASVWYLFQNHFYFVSFGVLHLIVDSFDGVLARATKSTLFGKYFDAFSDNILVVLIMANSYAEFGNPIYAFVALLYSVMLCIYFASRLKAPVLFARTITFIGYSLQFFFLSGLIVGVMAAIAIVMQLYHFTLFKPKK